MATASELRQEITETLEKINANSKFIEFKLNNELGNIQKPTNSVSVLFSFLKAVLELERFYGINERVSVHNNRQTVTLINPNHVTPMTLRVVIAISRTFSVNKGSLAGVSINSLYEHISREYEDKFSREQFYTEFNKLVERQLISITDDGVLKQFAIRNDLLGEERFFLLSPVVFTKKFTDMSAAAQKLYFYIMSRIDNRAKEFKFKEYIKSDSLVKIITHKDRPSQFKQLLKELEDCKAFENISLIQKAKVSKNHLLGYNAIEVTLEPRYIFPHEKGKAYRDRPKAKIPCSYLVKRMRAVLSHYNLIEYFKSKSFAEQWELIKFLNKHGLKALTYIISRLYELVNSKQLEALTFSGLLKIINRELTLPHFFEFRDILYNTGIINLIANESKEPSYISETIYLISEDAHTAKIEPTRFIDVAGEIAKESPKSKPHYLAWIRNKLNEILDDPPVKPSILSLFSKRFGLN